MSIAIEKVYEIYSLMLKIRLVEETIIREYTSKQIRTPVHLCIGQEAISAGVSAHLDEEDCIVSNHRCHGHSIAKGIDLEAFFKELYGKEGGVSGGRGGSMHICDMSKGIIGTSAIVAGGIPIGAGVALKQKVKKQPNITVIYFGDGAVDEGVFWETINFSALNKLPVLFVMEDNGFASQTSVNYRHSYEDITPIVSSFDVKVMKVDGNDSLEVSQTAGELIKKIRAGEGPGFLYCSTFRWMGHVGTEDDSHTGYRSKEEVELWRSRCPIDRLEVYLEENDCQRWEARKKEIKENLLSQINRALKCSKEASYAVD